MLTEVIDPLEGAGPDEVRPLADALANPDIEVVMHAGRQDIALLRRAWSTEIRGVFDTQVAGGFVGLGSQEGYESLVSALQKGLEGYGVPSAEQARGLATLLLCSLEGAMILARAHQSLDPFRQIMPHLLPLLPD